MFARVFPKLAKNIAKLRLKVIKKPWAGKSAPTSALRVFIAKFCKGKKGYPNLAGAHAAFKKLSPSQVQSFSKTAAENMKRKKALKARVNCARITPYSLFVKMFMTAIYKAEKGNHKNPRACFRAVQKKISAKYKLLTAKQYQELSDEVKRRRQKGRAFIEELMKERH